MNAGAYQDRKLHIFYYFGGEQSTIRLKALKKMALKNNMLIVLMNKTSYWLTILHV